MSGIGETMGGSRTILADGSFRLARVFMLLLIIVLPMSAITATREVAMAGTALFLAVAWWAQYGFSFRRTVVFLPLLFYAFCAVFSLVSAVDFRYSLSEVRSEILKPLIIFYSGVHFVNRVEHVRQAWLALLACAAIMVMGGVALFFYNGGSVFYHQLRAGSLNNGYGTFSTFLVTVWPYLLLAPLAFGKKIRLNVLYGLMLLTLIAGYLTFSRACWLAMLAEGWLVWVVLSRRRMRAVTTGLVVAAVAVGLLFTLPGSRHGENWQELVDEPGQVGGTAGDLMNVWHHTLREVAKHPFTGIGLGRHSFSKAYPNFRDENQPLLWHAHNMFLDITLQTGLQGLLALVWFLGTLVYWCWPRGALESGDDWRIFNAATAIMIIGFCLRNLTDDFFADDSALLMVLLSGLAMGALEAFGGAPGGIGGRAANNTRGIDK